MTRRIEFTVPDEVGEQYDRARGDVPMAAWIKRALESALGSVEAMATAEPDKGISVPSRAPGPPPPATPGAENIGKRKPSLADTWRR